MGDVVDFGDLLGSGPVMPVNRFQCSDFVNRGGRIPAPLLATQLNRVGADIGPCVDVH